MPNQVFLCGVFLFTRPGIKISDDSSIRCVVLSGIGEHFMAGGDVKSFYEKLEDEPDRTARRHYFEQLINTFHIGLTNMRNMPQPIVGKIRGAVAGAGVSLVLACDLALVSQDAFFTLAYCHIGTSPDGGSTHFLPRATSIKKAMEIDYLWVVGAKVRNNIMKLDDL